MERTYRIQPRKMKGKAAVIICVVFALLVKLASYCTNVVSDALSIFVYNENKALDMNDPRLGKAIFDFGGSFITHTAVLMLTIVSLAVLIIYFAKFYRDSSNTVFLPLAFGVIGLLQLATFIYYGCSLVQAIEAYVDATNIISEYIISLGSTKYVYMNGYLMDYQEYLQTFKESIYALIMPTVTGLFYTIVHAAITVVSLKGFISKPLAIIPPVLGIVGTVSFLLCDFIVCIVKMFAESMEFEYIIAHVGSFLVSMIGGIFFLFFFAGILIFAALNYIPELIPMREEKLEALMQKNPKKAKDILTLRYESGKLSEEDYNARISEIDATVS